MLTFPNSGKMAAILVSRQSAYDVHVTSNVNVNQRLLITSTLYYLYMCYLG